jgi:rhodanese-related sulfurtransferase
MSTNDPRGAVGAVTVMQAAALHAGDGAGPTPLLVDVRESGEFTALRAPGAVLVPLSSFGQHIDALPRDRQLLMICRSGIRSLNAGNVLVQHGFVNVVNVEGGMIAWQQAGLPTRSGPPDPGEGELAGR